MAGFNRWSHACCKFLCCVLQLVPHLAKKVWCVQCGSVVWEYVELGVCHWLVGQPFHFLLCQCVLGLLGALFVGTWKHWI